MPDAQPRADRTVRSCTRCEDTVVLQPCGCWIGRRSGTRYCTDKAALHQPARSTQPERCKGVPLLPEATGGGERWYAHPNDLIGGWSILTHDGPPSELDGHNGREVATFVNQQDARHIVDLHNAALDA